LLELAALLPDYEFMGEGNLGSRWAGSEKNWYCAIFYRRDRLRPVDGSGELETHWLSPTPEVPASQYPLGTRPRVVTWNTFELLGTGRPFVFGTTHLEAINSWHRIRSARQIRRFVSRKVAELGSDIPVFLTGDFNAPCHSPEIRAMVTDEPGLEPMYDAWKEGCDGNCEEGDTFRGLGLRDRVGHKLLGPRRIDYVFFRPRLTVTSVSRIDFRSMEHRERALPSDHYPVVAEIALAG
jgi:endonuclease/exonuclease/phosphatase family metal-dependent hydrolase